MSAGMFVANGLSIIALLGMGIALWPDVIHYCHVTSIQEYLVIPALIPWGLLLLCFLSVLNSKEVESENQHSNS